MATDTFDLNEILASLYRVGPTDDERKRAASQAFARMGMGILAANQPSAQPRNPLGVLAQGGLGGMDAYQADIQRQMQERRQGALSAVQSQGILSKAAQDKRVADYAATLPENDRQRFMIDPQAYLKATAPQSYTLPAGAVRMGPDGKPIAAAPFRESPAPQPPSGFRPTASGDLEPIPGGPADQRMQPKDKPPSGYRLKPDGNLEAIPGGPADLKAQGVFNQDMATLSSTSAGLDRLAVAANEVMRHPGLAGITGLRGMIPNIPGTPAADAKAKLETLKAQVGFGVLQEMRNASKTGGALGQVTEKELAFLQNALAAVDQAQSEGQLQESLQKIIDYAASGKARLQNAFNLKHKQEAAPSERPPVPPPADNRKRIRYDSRGNRIP